MADKDHVKRLRQGVSAWNQWRTDHPEVVPDLSEENLFRIRLEGGANLSRANLHRTDLSYATLTLQANLQGADLSGANLSHADLHAALIEKANLRGANLREANLHLADLRGADLSGADLSDADITGARLYDASLRGATVERTRFDDAEGLEKAVKADLRARGALFQGPLTYWAEKYLRE